MNFTRKLSQDATRRDVLSLDTYKMSKTLQEHEFTRSQASCIVDFFRHETRKILEDCYEKRLTRLQYEKDNYVYRVVFSMLKSELQAIEKNEVSLIKMQHEKIGREIERTQQKLLEDLALLKSNIIMEMNTHRETIRDLATWTLQRRMYEVNNHLNIELSKIRIQMESIRLIVAGYLAAIIFAAGTLFVFYKYYQMKHPREEQRLELEESNQINL